MKKFLLCLMVLLSLACVASAWTVDRDNIVSTAEWQPPEIDENCKDTQPWLLVLKVAQEEIGYVEGPLNDQSKYGEWYCGRRVAWCAEFLTWCVNEADTRYGTTMLKDMFPYYGKSSEGAPWFMEKGRFISDNAIIPVSHEEQWFIGADTYMQEHEYIPQPGDYMWFFWYSRKKGTDHVAIVEGVSRDEDGTIQVHVIEGNNPDRVQRATYALDYKLIYGYGTPERRAYTAIHLYTTCDDVPILQKNLELLGYFPKKSTYMNQASRDLMTAVKSFQKDNGLEVKSSYNLETRAALEAAVAALGETESGGDETE